MKFSEVLIVIIIITVFFYSNIVYLCTALLHKLHLDKLHVISICKNMQEYLEMLIYKIIRCN